MIHHPSYHDAAFWSGIVEDHSSFMSWCHHWWHFHVIIVLVESHTFFIHLMLQSRWISLAVYTSSTDTCGAVAWWIPFQVFANLSSHQPPFKHPGLLDAPPSLLPASCFNQVSWLVEGSNIPCPFLFHISQCRILANLRHLHENHHLALLAMFTRGVNTSLLQLKQGWFAVQKGWENEYTLAVLWTQGTKKLSQSLRRPTKNSSNIRNLRTSEVHSPKFNNYVLLTTVLVPKSSQTTPNPGHASPLQQTAQGQLSVSAILDFGWGQRRKTQQEQVWLQGGSWNEDHLLMNYSSGIQYTTCQMSQLRWTLFWFHCHSYAPRFLWPGDLPIHF